MSVEDIIRELVTWLSERNPPEKIAAGSRLSWTPTTGIDLVRSMLCAASPEVDRIAAIGKMLGVRPNIVLLIMRLWKTKYTLSTHGKVKRAMP